jgi:hypothetical protein
MRQTFLGLDAADWTGISAGALVLVTLIYVIVTGRLARHAGRSARAAESSAKSAEMAVTRLVSLRIDFAASYTDVTGIGPHVTLRSRGATVFVRRVVVDMGLIRAAGKDEPEMINGELPLADAREKLPYLLHRDEALGFRWPFPTVNVREMAVAFLDVEYSVEKDGAPRRLQRLLEFPLVPEPQRPRGRGRRFGR